MHEDNIQPKMKTNTITAIHFPASFFSQASGTLSTKIWQVSLVNQNLTEIAKQTTQYLISAQL